MNNKLKFTAMTFATIFAFGCSSPDIHDIDLKQALNITVNSIYTFEEQYGETFSTAAAQEGNQEQASVEAFLNFSDFLQSEYNQAEPRLDDFSVGVWPQTDASLIAFSDINQNGEWDDAAGENALFMIEIDGENSRVIATSNSGAVDEYRVSGSGFLAGYLIGSLLTRQRVAGVNTSNLATKKPITAAAARSRAGSGSYSRGK